MKLYPLAIVVFLLSPATAANCSRRHRRTLSQITKTLSALAKTLSPFTKKPASLAGFLYLILRNIRRTAPFLPAAHFP
jgi:hypothetical protein